ncbi:TRAP transporter small permease [Pontibacterium granulatum]|uniref:TRAP transporter small permease n=1 Tax=Pontibacterium granulatum TaxID=2036029 RepID=UPI00249B4A5C|nr:TRAP transporter small permease [Pontibacterium granulatum]MDI3325271.1 TRAP transporter small permease [Pontibacterium granulatum]
MISQANSPHRLLSSLDTLIDRAEAFILAWGVMLMATNTIANVFGRYVFSQSIYFTEELNEFLIIIITFMGLGYVTRKGRHIRMSAFYDLLPARAKKLMMVLIASLTAVVMFILAWYAFEYVAKIARRGRVTPALQVPLYMTYVWVVAGFALTGIQYVLTMVKNLNLADEDVYISYTTVDQYEDPEVSEVMHLYKQDHELEMPDESPTHTDRIQTQVQEIKS